MPADRNLQFNQADNVLTFTRQFDASAKNVWRAHTEVELIVKWLLGPPGWSMPACKFEAKVGGKYRYDWAHPDEQGFSIGGTVLDFVPNARMVHTEKFDGVDMGGETVVVTQFAEADGVTTMRMTIIYETPDIIETVLATGMTEGMQQSYTNLDKLLAG